MKTILLIAERSGRFENLESSAHIQVKEIIGVFLATNFVDAVPGRYVHNAITAAKRFIQLFSIQDGSSDKYLTSQIAGRAKVENYRRITSSD